MGRTKRLRKKKNKTKNPASDWTNITKLQKSLRLKCDNLKIGYFGESGRGLKCRKTLNEGDVLIALPLNVLITPNTPNKILSLLKTWKSHPQLDLAVLLVYEKHLENESKYYEYIATLPDSYTNLYFSTDEEIKLLPNFLQKLVITQKENVSNSYNKVISSLKDFSCSHCDTHLSSIFSRETFDWAWFTVNTRSVYYENEDKETKLLALAPFLDMLNHSSEANTKMIIDHKEKLYILRTMVKLKKYEEAFIKYGSHSNLTLLVEYGFIISKNPYDLIEFSFEEVLSSVRELNSEYGDLTKSKYKFIVGNNLHKNLTKSHEGFSWQMNALLFVLIHRDESISSLQRILYSNELNFSKQIEVKNLQKTIINKKMNKLSNMIFVMNEIVNCTESYQLAKQLLRIYVRLLETECTN